MPHRFSSALVAALAFSAPAVVMAQAPDAPAAPPEGPPATAPAAGDAPAAAASPTPGATPVAVGASTEAPPDAVAPAATAPPSAAAVVEGPVTPVGAAPPPTGAEPPVPLPKRLAAGSHGTLQLGLTFQGWAFLAHAAGSADETALTLRIRRLQVSAKGDLVPEKVSYALMIDPAKTLRFGTEVVEVQNQDPPPSEPAAPETVQIHTPPADRSILQDAYVTFASPYVDLTVGQYRIPVSLAGLGSTKELPLPEDPLVARTFGGRSRDLGVKLEKTFEHFHYDLGLYNGQGLNQIDGNLQKDLGLRLEVYPLDGLLLGVMGYGGVGERDEPGTKDRVEGDLRIEVENALLQLEYIHAWSGPDGDRTEGHGGYALAGYTFAERYQPVARVGFVDTDVTEGDTLTRHYELGLNYFVRGNDLKLQAAYALFHSDVDAEGGGEVAPRHEGTLAVQLAF